MPTGSAHQITYPRRGRAQNPEDAIVMRRSPRLEPCRARTLQGHSPFYLRRRSTRSTGALCGGQYRARAYVRVSKRCLPRIVRRRVSTSCRRWSTAGSCPARRPVHPNSRLKIWRRHADNAGTRCPGALTQRGADAALRGRGCRASNLPVGSDADIRTSIACIRSPPPSPIMSSDGLIRFFASPTLPAGAVATPGLHGSWTGCRTKTACSTSRARFCRASGRQSQTPRSASSGARQRRRCGGWPSRRASP